MTFEQRRRLVTGPLAIELTQEEILADLCYPGPQPGQWLGVPVHAEQVETSLEQVEQKAA